MIYNLPENKTITLIINNQTELIGIEFEDKKIRDSRRAYLITPIRLEESGYAFRGLERKFYIGGQPEKYGEENLHYIDTGSFILNGPILNNIDIRKFLEGNASYDDIFER